MSFTPSQSILKNLSKKQPCSEGLSAKQVIHFFSLFPFVSLLLSSFSLISLHLLYQFIYFSFRVQFFSHSFSYIPFHFPLCFYLYLYLSPTFALIIRERCTSVRFVPQPTSEPNRNHYHYHYLYPCHYHYHYHHHYHYHYHLMKSNSCIPPLQHTIFSIFLPF